MEQPKTFAAFAFEPEGGLTDTAYSPSEPESESAIRAQIQGVSDQLRDHINAVQTALGSQTEGDAGADYIGAAEIANLGGGSVGAQLASLKALVDAVVLGDIPDGSLTEAKLGAGSVTEEKLASGAVTGDKLTAESVTAAKLTAGAVTSAKLADGAVTGAKLAAGSVTNDKLGSISGIMHRQVITESGQWSPPVSALYRVTLYGGGGGGGSGFYKSINGMSSGGTNGWLAGAGGAYSKPVSASFYLRADYSYAFVIGAGGTGRSGNSCEYTAGSTLTISSGDVMASNGGESQFLADATVLLGTTASGRTAGGQYKVTRLGVTPSSNQVLYGGRPGMGPGGADECASVHYSSTRADIAVAATPGKFGAGAGGAVNCTLSHANTPIPGGSSTQYGCGGGGGGATYDSFSVINPGGNGGDGVAIIEWFE